MLLQTGGETLSDDYWLLLGYYNFLLGCDSTYLAAELLTPWNEVGSKFIPTIKVQAIQSRSSVMSDCFSLTFGNYLTSTHIISMSFLISSNTSYLQSLLFCPVPLNTGVEIRSGNFRTESSS